MERFRCSAMLSKRSDQWCSNDSVWVLAYTTPASESAVMRCCATHLHATALKVEQIKHPLSRVDLLKLEKA